MAESSFPFNVQQYKIATSCRNNGEAKRCSFSCVRLSELLGTSSLFFSFLGYEDIYMFFYIPFFFFKAHTLKLLAEFILDFPHHLHSIKPLIIRFHNRSPYDTPHISDHGIR